MLRSLSGVPYLITLYEAIDLFAYGGDQETMLVFEYMDFDLLGTLYSLFTALVVVTVK